MNVFEWAGGILVREINSKLYGTVTYSFQNGNITGCKVERSEKPPIVDNKSD